MGKLVTALHHVEKILQITTAHQ